MARRPNPLKLFDSRNFAGRKGRRGPTPIERAYLIEGLEPRQLLSGNGLSAIYYNAVNLTQPAVTRVDSTVNFNWGSGSPAPAVNTKDFSAMWSGQVLAPATGNYKFYTTSDDGVRLWVNGIEIINNWADHSATVNSGTIALKGGVKYDITMEYYQDQGSATAILAWTPPGQQRQVIPQSALFSTAAGSSRAAGISTLASPNILPSTAAPLDATAAMPAVLQGSSDGGALATQSGSALSVNLNGAGPVTLSGSGASVTVVQGTTTMSFTGVLSVSVTGSAASNVLNFSGPLAIPFSFTGNATTTLNVSSGSLFFAGAPGSTVTLGTLAIAAGAEAVLPAASGAQTELSVSSLSITTGGTLDIANNFVIVNYGTGSDPFTSIKQAVNSGYNGGAENGTGIISSMAALAANNGSYSVGYADSADNIDPSLSNGQVEIAYVLYGDETLQGAVSGSDYTILAENFGKSVTGGWEDGDFTGGGGVTGADFTLLAENFGKTASITMPLVNADSPAAPISGLNYEYYQGTWSTLPNFSSLTPIKGGLATDFSLAIRNLDADFGFTFNGYVDVPTSGVYTFSTNSDNGSDLYIDGSMIVNNDGLHASQTRSGTVALAAGMHAIEVTYFQQSGVPLLQVSYAGPGLATQIIPDSALFGTSPGTIDVANYGAAGNGTTNDSTAIQNAINAAPDGSTLVLDSGKTYLLGTGLAVYKPINIEGNGATLLLDTSSNPANETVFYQSPLSSSDTYNWTQTVTSGQTTFNVAIPTTSIIPGDKIFVQLGTDPDDSTQPNWAEVVTVVANTGSTITIDTPVPYNITQGSRSNNIQRITDLAVNTTIQDINYNWVSNTTPDTQLWVTITQGTHVNNITGNFTIAENIVDTRNVVVNGITGTLDKLDSSSGRALTGWQDDGLSVSNINVNTAYDAPIVFFESWQRNSTLNNITVTSTNTDNPPTAGTFDFTGNSYGTYVNNVTINNSGPAYLVASGVQPAQYSFGNVTITGTVLAAPLTDISYLNANGVIFDQSKLVTVKTVVPITDNMNYASTNLDNGQAGEIETISFLITSTTGLSDLYVVNNHGSGNEIHSALTANVTYVLAQIYGTNDALDNTAYPYKHVSLVTGSNVPAGTTLTIYSTYYPGT